MSSATVHARTRFLDDSWRVGGVCGIGFLVLFFVGIFGQGDSPMFGDNVADYRSSYAAHADRYVLFNWIISLAIVFLFVPFASALRGILGTADAPGGMWARVAFTGALVFLILGGAASAFTGALALTE